MIVPNRLIGDWKLITFSTRSSSMTSKGYYSLENKPQTKMKTLLVGIIYSAQRVLVIIHQLGIEKL